MQTPDLLPCPFCGNAAELVLPKDTLEGSPFVQCTVCGMNNGIRTTYYQEKTSADVVIKRWNTRAALGPEDRTLLAGKLNLQKLDDAVLAMLALNLNTPEFNPAELDADTYLHYQSLHRLHKAGMLSERPSDIPERGVYLSPAGARRAHEIFRKLFCD